MKNSKNEKKQTPNFQKRIGTTVYRVSIHFSETSKETIEDKMLRPIENEVRKTA